jgi:hypothetical protein
VQVDDGNGYIHGVPVDAKFLGLSVTVVLHETWDASYVYYLPEGEQWFSTPELENVNVFASKLVVLGHLGVTVERFSDIALIA